MRRVMNPRNAEMAPAVLAKSASRLHIAPMSIGTNRTSRGASAFKREAVVVYRGIKIPAIGGKRSATAEAIRKALRTSSGQPRGKSTRR